VAVTNAYCSVDDVRAQLGDDAQRLDQALLERAVNAASRQVDKYCARRFWRDAAVTTRVYRATDSRSVWTDDISTTTGLVVASDPGGDGTYETAWTLGTDYAVEPLSGDAVASGDTVTPYAFWRLSGVGTRVLFPRSSVGFPAVQVTARFGWSAIPDDVAMATILKATALYKRKDAPFGVAGFGDFGAVKISRSDPDVADLLRGYVKTRPRTLSYDTQRGSLFHGRSGLAW